MRFPEGSLASLPAPVAEPDDPQPADIVWHYQFIEALRPVLELCGTSPEAVFYDEFAIDSGEIRFISAVPVAGVEAVVVGGDDPEFAEYGWPVAIPISEPGHYPDVETMRADVAAHPVR